MKSFTFLLCLLTSVLFAVPAYAELVVYDPPLLIPLDREYKCRNKFPPDPTEVFETDSPNLLFRCPPRKFPHKCRRKAAAREIAHLLYDVGGSGIPENIRIRQTTNPCFNEEAAIAVAMWRYEADGRGGVDLSTTMEFQLQ